MFFTSTRLPLAKARWVPRINGHPLMPYNDIRPSTPQDSADRSSGSSLTPAWDPSSRTPRASTSASDGDSDRDFDALSLWSSSFYPQPSLLPPQPKPGIAFSFQMSVPYALHSGEWLLHPQLLHKKLDVRIRGTTITLCHNARYENECGFLIPDKKFTSVNDSIVVKVGYN